MSTPGLYPEPIIFLYIKNTHQQFFDKTKIARFEKEKTIWSTWHDIDKFTFILKESPKIILTWF